MNGDSAFGPELESLIGQQVVVDTRGPYLYIGTLDRIDSNSLLLTEVDVHDTRESSTSNELYLIQSLKMGVRPNRRAVYVISKEIVSISRLSDIVPY